MPYATSKEKVEQNAHLLGLIKVALDEGKPFELEATESTKLNKLAYQMHELFASAQEYPQEEWHRKIRSRAKITTDRVAGKVIIQPKSYEPVQESLQDKLMPLLVEAVSRLGAMQDRNTTQMIVREEREGDDEAFIKGAAQVGWRATLLETIEGRNKEKAHKFSCTRMQEEDTDKKKEEEEDPFALL